MTIITRYLDVAMCALWIITYTFVLIGTIKYKYPLIAPMAQAIIAPFEISVCILSFTTDALLYVSMAYLYWSLIEIAILIVIMKSGFLKKRLWGYVFFIIVFSIITLYIIMIHGYVLVCSYIYTFAGILVWFIFILNKDYPMRPISLAIFCIKFLADIFAAIVYFGKGGGFINILCILLPILHFLFIIVYIVRTRELKKGGAYAQKHKK